MNHGVFPKWGAPQNGWFITENLTLKSVWFRGSSISENLHVFWHRASQNSVLAISMTMIRIASVLRPRWLLKGLCPLFLDITTWGYLKRKCPFYSGGNHFGTKKSTTFWDKPLYRKNSCKISTAIPKFCFKSLPVIYIGIISSGCALLFCFPIWIHSKLPKFQWALLRFGPCWLMCCHMCELYTTTNRRSQKAFLASAMSNVITRHNTCDRPKNDTQGLW